MVLETCLTAQTIIEAVASILAGVCSAESAKSR